MGTIRVLDPAAGSGARTMAAEAAADLSTVGIKAYPVPLAKDRLWIELPAREESGAWELGIFDIQGKKVAETSIEGHAFGTKKHWPLVHQSWKEGVYLLKIKKGEEQYELKILK